MVNISSRIFEKSIRNRLKELEERGCLPLKQMCVLEEDIEEKFGKDSTQMKRFKKARVKCEYIKR